MRIVRQNRVFLFQYVFRYAFCLINPIFDRRKDVCDNEIRVFPNDESTLLLDTRLDVSAVQERKWTKNTFYHSHPQDIR